jgi:hypothetical protein
MQEALAFHLPNSKIPDYAYLIIDGWAGHGVSVWGGDDFDFMFLWCSKDMIKDIRILLQYL